MSLTLSPAALGIQQGQHDPRVGVSTLPSLTWAFQFRPCLLQITSQILNVTEPHAAVYGPNSYRPDGSGQSLGLLNTAGKPRHRPPRSQGSCHDLTWVQKKGGRHQ